MPGTSGLPASSGTTRWGTSELGILAVETNGGVRLGAQGVAGAIHAGAAQRILRPALARRCSPRSR